MSSGHCADGHRHCSRSAAILSRRPRFALLPFFLIRFFETTNVPWRMVQVYPILFLGAPCCHNPSLSFTTHAVANTTCRN